MQAEDKHNKESMKKSTDLTWVEAAKMVLKANPATPMSHKEILKVIEAENLKQMRGTAPLPCLNALLNAMSHGPDSIFYKVAGRMGVYGLKDDLPEGVVLLEMEEEQTTELNLDETGEPLDGQPLKECSSTEFQKQKVYYAQLPPGVKTIPPPPVPKPPLGVAVQENLENQPTRSVQDATAESTPNQTQGHPVSQVQPLRRSLRARKMRRGFPRIIVKTLPPRPSRSSPTTVFHTSTTTTSISEMTCMTSMMQSTPVTISSVAVQPVPKSVILPPPRNIVTALRSSAVANTRSRTSLKDSVVKNGVLQPNEREKVNNDKGAALKKTEEKEGQKDDKLTYMSAKKKYRRYKKQTNKTAEQSDVYTPQETVDLSTPDSVLIHTTLRNLINKHTLMQLPPSCQLKLIKKLPEVDQLECGGIPKNISGSVLNNEFFASALHEWQEKLATGEFLPDSKQRVKLEREKDLGKLDPWKLKHFEPVWGQTCASRRYDPAEFSSINKLSKRSAAKLNRSERKIPAAVKKSSRIAASLAKRRAARLASGVAKQEAEGIDKKDDVKSNVVCKISTQAEEEEEKRSIGSSEAPMKASKVESTVDGEPVPVKLPVWQQSSTQSPLSEAKDVANDAERNVPSSPPRIDSDVTKMEQVEAELESGGAAKRVLPTEVPKDEASAKRLKSISEVPVSSNPTVTIVRPASPFAHPTTTIANKAAMFTQQLKTYSALRAQAEKYVPFSMASGRAFPSIIRPPRTGQTRTLAQIKARTKAKLAATSQSLPQARLQQNIANRVQHLSQPKPLNSDSPALRVQHHFPTPVQIVQQSQLSSTDQSSVMGTGKTPDPFLAQIVEQKSGGVNLQRSYQICEAVLKSSKAKDSESLLSKNKKPDSGSPPKITPSILINGNISLDNASVSNEVVSGLAGNVTLANSLTTASVTSVISGSMPPPSGSNNNLINTLPRAVASTTVSPSDNGNLQGIIASSGSKILKAYPSSVRQNAGLPGKTYYYVVSSGDGNKDIQRASSAPPVSAESHDQSALRCASADDIKPSCSVHAIGHSVPSASVSGQSANTVLQNTSMSNGDIQVVSLIPGKPVPNGMLVGNAIKPFSAQTIVDGQRPVVFTQEQQVLVQNQPNGAVMVVATPGRPAQLPQTVVVNEQQNTDQSNCVCNLKPMHICKNCGAFCHDDCIGPSKLCVTCLIR